MCCLQVAGTSGKALLEGGSDDEGASTEAHGRAIIEVLGRDKRNEVLAAVYMVRTDVSLSVRQVYNTVSTIFTTIFLIFWSTYSFFSSNNKQF